MIRINIFKKDDLALLTGLISMISLIFGIFLAIKYGLILDYAKEDMIIQSSANLMSKTALACILSGLIFIFISIMKFIIWKVKEAGGNGK